MRSRSRLTQIPVETTPGVSNSTNSGEPSAAPPREATSGDLAPPDPRAQSSPPSDPEWTRTIRTAYTLDLDREIVIQRIRSAHTGSVWPFC